MSLNVKDLLKKAEAKGIKPNKNVTPSQQPLFRPWQQESVLFNKNEKLISSETIIKQKPDVNWQQTGNKLATNRKQIDNKLATNWQQTGNKLDTQLATQSATNWQQTGNKLATNCTFSELIGLQRDVILFIYNECKISREKFTNNLSREYISESLKSSAGSIKTTIQRLEKKGFIIRVCYKNGRGGWSRYSIPDTIFQELLQHESGNKLATNWQQSGNKVGTQLGTQLATSSLSSSSNFLLKETTTTGDQTLNNKKTLAEVWTDLDFSLLAKIGFTKTHLLQIADQNKLTPEIVQQSIFAFAFDLKHNDKAKKIKGEPLNFFMGILRNGQPYAPPPNYETPQEKAMRLYVERQKEIESRRAALEEEAFKIAFEAWYKTLSDEDKRTIAPNAPKIDGGMMKVLISAHFKETLWEEQQKAIFLNNSKTNEKI